MSTELNNSKYMIVSANTTEILEETPENNSVVCISELGGSGAYSQEVKVEIKWDTEILFVTHDEKLASHAKRIIRLLDGKIDQDYYL